MAFVGQNIPHDSARGHVSGESVFLDDMPPLRGEVHCGTVGSPVAHGEIASIDTSEARSVPGVAAILTHEDVPGHNDIGPVVKDEQVLAAGEAHYVGQPIVLIAAETREALAQARKRVKIVMRDRPAIFSIEQAIAAGSFLGPERKIERGQVEQAFAAAGHVLEGELSSGGQEQFYFESQIAIAVPGEHGTMTVHSSTQHPSEVQMTVAEALGVPFNHVVCVCKRMGGGFGGKETQAAQPAALAAIAARLLGRPARLMLGRDEDMAITGKRHPFKGAYRVAFDDRGLIEALDLRLWSNGGFSLDLSTAVLERALLHSDNAYFIPNFRVTGRICRTNLPSNTAFRGFGGPQGVLNIENIIEEIAQTLGIDALEVRRRNCYGIEERNETPYGQVVRNNTLGRLFEELSRSCDYTRRRNAIELFNAGSRTQLRGMSLTAVKFGISFTRRAMNQANALVNLYQDGSVIVSTGGTEMGQGVNTRVRQLVADELGVDYAGVIVTATSTDKNNNTSPTAASAGTDLNGAAAIDACRKLKARLGAVAAGMLGVSEAVGHGPGTIAFADGKVFDSRNADRTLSFGEVVCQAYEQRVNLGERGFYATPGVDFDRETGRGEPFLYFTNGVCCSEVLIDRFTGEMRVARVDLLMDAGESINPGIDRGQIVGGFVQGMGWVTSEELRYSPIGVLWSHSPTTYKIPNITDLPEVFNVATIVNRDNEVSLKRSKAVGEPPLLLGISVWTAVKNAVSYVSQGAVARLDAPATPERILMALTRYARRSSGEALREEVTPGGV